MSMFIGSAGSRVKATALLLWNATRQANGVHCRQPARAVRAAPLLPAYRVTGLEQGPKETASTPKSAALKPPGRHFRRTLTPIHLARRDRPSRALGPHHACRLAMCDGPGSQLTIGPLTWNRNELRKAPRLRIRAKPLHAFSLGLPSTKKQLTKHRDPIAQRDAARVSTGLIAGD